MICLVGNYVFLQITRWMMTTFLWRPPISADLKWACVCIIHACYSLPTAHMWMGRYMPHVSTFSVSLILKPICVRPANNKSIRVLGWFFFFFFTVFLSSLPSLLNLPFPLSRVAAWHFNHNATSTTCWAKMNSGFFPSAVSSFRFKASLPPLPSLPPSRGFRGGFGWNGK